MPSGPIRKNAWVEGWQQNLDESIADGINHKTLLPHYYRQGKTVMRYMGEFILPEDDFFEAKFLTIIRKILAHYFLTEHKNIYEFGAGPCHNILYFAHEVQEKNFYWFHRYQTTDGYRRFLGNFFVRFANKIHCLEIARQTCSGAE